MSFNHEREHRPAKEDYLKSVIHRLETLCEDILAEIDGGEDCRGRDSQLAAWSADIENVVTMLKTII